MKKVNQVQEYFNWIFFLKWALGSQCVEWLWRLVPLRGNKLRIASATKQATGVIRYEMQEEKNFSKFSPDPIVLSAHYLVPIRGDCFLVKIAHSSQI
ncbi:MAG: hypothetical protein RM368_07575 [Nostoc sp. DedSLP03]|uniref:hypothetical protein n=1 Tax=Nostoc sp. DedSLP03 TaxID=3075400 RepID=UPI002AD32FAE|nr:hypothetical protein [Nostoc sp. DedSLP03]MDZ7964823.1 hypothetical protein [Nostoc sp. DedSLP03]